MSTFIIAWLHFNTFIIAWLHLTFLAMMLIQLHKESKRD